MRRCLITVLGLLAVGACSDDASPTAPLMETNAKSVVDFGAVPDDGVDDTEAFRRAVTGGGAVFVPAGRFEARGTITLPDETRVFGTGPASLIVRTAGEGALFVANGSDADRAVGITVEDLSVEGEGGISFVLRAVSAERIVVRRVHARKIGLIHTLTAHPINVWDQTEDPAATAGLVSESQLSGNILVEDNTGDGLGAGGYAVLLTYSRDAVVRGNDVKNYMMGIQWWGGDANYERGGGVEHDNPRWARRLLIENNRVHEGQASIWGSMGEDILVLGNTVDTCHDVCLDAEGSTRVRFEGNTASEAVNGVLAVFFHSRDIEFVNNTVSQSGRLGKVLFHTWNHAQTPFDISVVLKGNRLTYTGAEGVGVVTHESSRLLRVEKNYLTNTALHLVANNGGEVHVIGNELRFSRALEGVPAIGMGGNHGSYGSPVYPATVDSNLLLSSVRQASTAPGIDLTAMGAGADVPLVIARNEIRGFPLAIQSRFSGSRAGAELRGNMRDGAIRLTGSVPVFSERVSDNPWITVDGKLARCTPGTAEMDDSPRSFARAFLGRGGSDWSNVRYRSKAGGEWMSFTACS